METISNILDLFSINNQPLTTEVSEEVQPIRIRTEYLGTSFGPEYEASVGRLMDYKNMTMRKKFYEDLKPYAQDIKPMKGFWDSAVTFLPSNLDYYGVETSVLYREVRSYLESDTGNIKEFLDPSSILVFNEGAFRYYSGSYQTTIKHYTVSKHSYGDIFISLCKEYPHVETDHFHVVELESWDRIEIVDPSKFHWFPGSQKTNKEVHEYRQYN